MAVVLRTVCVFSVFLALEAAPTVTYDQRQQGEYNLQVDLDDVAIVFLPGGEFRQKNALAGRVHQLFGRRNGVTGHSKKKHKPTAAPANCGSTTATTPAYTTAKPVETPENEYGETPVLQASGRPSTNPAPVSEVHEPAGPADENDLGYYDPYSVTPNTPNIFKNDVFEAGTAEESTGTAHAAKPVLGAGDTVAELAEMVAVKTVDKPAAVDVPKEFPTGANTPAAVDETTFEENPVSVSSDIKTVEKTPYSAGETVKSGETPTVAEDKSSNVMTAAKIADKPAEQEAENAAKVTTTNTKPEDNEQVEVIATKTVDIPVKPVEKSATNTQHVQDAKKVNEPLEMVAVKTMEIPAFSEAVNVAKKPAAAITDKTAVSEAADVPTATLIDTNKKPAEMKTMEKPTFAEALKVAKKPSDPAAFKNAVVPKTGVSAAAATQEPSNKPVEMVAIKTAEKPPNMWSADSVEKSEGIMTSTKVVEIQEEKKIPSDPAAVETIVSRTAPKSTEMVAVKTMENPATVTTVKSVTAVKTVVKSGTPKTTLSSNGSSILRKVGDRKPLPSITMEIATPKVVQ